MARKSAYTLSGEITNRDWATTFDSAKQGCLNITGAIIRDKMRELTTPYDSSGRTTNSITWRTKKTGSNISAPAISSDRISAPASSDEVWIGSEAPSAVAREYPQGPHKTDKGTDEFIKNMKEWVQRELNIDADGSPAEQQHFWWIINSIRTRTYDAHPFVSPMIQEVGPVMTKAWETAIRQSIRAFKKVKGRQ
jgi:hypothetical protein